MTDVIRRHWYALHWPLPPRLTAGGTAFGIGDDPPRGEHFQTSVASAVAAEHAGMDGVLCADATDWYVPGSVWNGELADTLEGAPDPHAVFTSEPIIAAAGAVTDRIEFLWGPVDCVRRAPVNIAHMVLDPRPRDAGPGIGRPRAGPDRSHAPDRHQPDRREGQALGRCADRPQADPGHGAVLVPWPGLEVRPRCACDAVLRRATPRCPRRRQHGRDARAGRPVRRRLDDADRRWPRLLREPGARRSAGRPNSTDATPTRCGSTRTSRAS